MKSIICFVLVALALQLTSCKEEKKVRKAKAHKEETIASDTIFDRESPYYIFIQKNNAKAIKEELLFFQEKDIDLDGLNEAVVALGKNTDQGPHINNLFVLKNDGGTIKQVVGHFNLKDPDFFANEVSLVSLQGQQQSYIAVKYMTPSYNRGISVFELTDNHLKIICQSGLSRFEKQYEESLIDENDDGQYEGYLQHDVYDDVINYYQDTNFVFENGVFKQKTSQKFMDPYPDAIQDVLLQYIRLRSEPFSDNIINYRLSQLCIDNDANTIKWNKNWHGVGVRSYYQIRDGMDLGIFEIQQDDDTANVTATNKYVDTDKIEHFYQLKFELQKTDDKWQITNVEVIR